MKMDSSSIGKGNGSLTFWRGKNLGKPPFWDSLGDTGPNPNIRFSRGTTEIRVHVDLQTKRDSRPCGKRRTVSFWHQKNNRFPSGPWQNSQKSCKIYSSLIFQQISWATKYPKKNTVESVRTVNLPQPPSYWDIPSTNFVAIPLKTNSKFAPEKWWQIGRREGLSFWDSAFQMQLRTGKFQGETTLFHCPFLKLKISVAIYMFSNRWACK